MSTHYQPGRYRVVINDHSLTTNKKGNPHILLRFTILSLYVNDSLHPTDRHTRTSFLTITDNTVTWIIDTLRHLGWRGSSFAELASGQDIFGGIETDATCSHSDYNGQTNEKWMINHAGSVQSSPLSPALIQQLDTRFSQTLRASLATPVSTTQPTSLPPTNSENDIPF